MISDFDLCIIGGYYDQRKRYIYSFLLGVMDKKDDGEDESTFHAVGRVHNGLNREQMRKIRHKLEPHWVKVRSSKEGRKTISHNPKCIEWNQAAPDVWIEPKHSIVLQVKASELVRTSTFRTSHTLRFPRVVAVRDDKPWHDCCSLQEFEAFLDVSNLNKGNWFKCNYVTAFGFQ